MQPGAARNKQVAVIIFLVVFAVGLFALTLRNTNSESRSPEEKIQAQFGITLPANVRNAAYWAYNWMGYETLAKFTVDAADLDATLQSVTSDENHCIREAKTEGFLPDFFVDPSLDWWQPFTAQAYAGISCHDAPPDGIGSNYNVMVDTTNPAEATVYIELYSTDKGKRALRG